MLCCAVLCCESIRIEIRTLSLPPSVGITLLPISAVNKLPNSCAKKAATQAGARKVDPAHHEAIMAEAVCRDRLEYDSESDSDADEESGSESDAAKDGSDAED
jgi:hypothetical protein